MIRTFHQLRKMRIYWKW